MSVIDILQPWTTAGVDSYRAGIAKLVEASGVAPPPPGSEPPALDPALFAYFARAAEPEEATLGQLTASWAPARDRPASVPAVAGRDGFAHLPGLGYARVRRERDGETGPGRALLAGLEPEDRLSRAVQAVTRDLPSAVACIERAAGHGSTSVRATWREHGADLHAAWETIERLDPQLSSLLGTALEQVVLFREEDCNSFADAAYFGAAFCNMALGSGAVFLVEDLAHQGGHNVLMAAAANPAQWFTTDPGRVPVDGASGHGRDLYVLWHGTVTEALMADVLHRWLEEATDEEPADGETVHELRGRYAFVLTRFSTDLARLRPYGALMTPLGNELLDAVAEAWATHVRVDGEWVAGVDLTGQGYNFSYETYCRRHPLPRATTAAGRTS